MIESMIDGLYDERSVHVRGLHLREQFVYRGSVDEGWWRGLIGGVRVAAGGGFFLVGPYVQMRIDYFVGGRGGGAAAAAAHHHGEGEGGTARDCSCCVECRCKRGKQIRNAVLRSGCHFMDGKTC